MTSTDQERQKFVSYDILPCVSHLDPFTFERIYEVCERDAAGELDEPDVWTLYGRLPDGKAVAIGDFVSAEAAELIYYRITGQNYVRP